MLRLARLRLDRLMLGLMGCAVLLMLLGSAEAAKPNPYQKKRDLSCRIVGKYFDAYLSGNAKAMDKVAGPKAKYQRLVSSKMPRRLLLYMVDDGIVNEKLETAAWQASHVRICANDDQGRTREFLVRTENGKVAEVKLTGPKVIVKRGWRRLTAADRLDILGQSGLEKAKQNERYVDFGNDASYKGYVEADQISYPGAGAAVFYHRKNGRWRYLMFTQDYTMTSELKKMGVPPDVQKEVWGSTPEEDAQNR